jgi:L-ascorbate metabolism protein UlaG (beta-lactamase superfamily)
VRIEFLGHSAFLIETGEYYLLLDPFLKGNPSARKTPEEIKPTHIFVSHGHDDHLGSTIYMAKASGAIVYATFELAGQLGKEGLNVREGHIGGKQIGEFGSIKFFNAQHGSGILGGHACGFVLGIENKKVYFAGDTGLFGDMSFLADEEIDIAMVPIGDLFTMGPEDAIKAVKLIKPRYVIPMHYNTFPAIKQDPVKFKESIENETNSTVIILSPGEIFEL